MGMAVRQLLGVAMGEQASVAGGEDETLDLPCATSLEIPGRTIERYVGLCWGLTVRSVGFSKGITGAVRSLKAGEVAEYTNVVEQARHHALQRLVEHARAQGGTPSSACASTRVRSASSSRRSSPTEPQS